MTLQELLDFLRGPILNDRSARVSGSSDYLWTDDQLVTMINEAQRRFAALSLILRDSTTKEVTEVTLVEGQTEYPLHESVLAVLSARRFDQQADLTRVGHPVLAAYRPTSEGWVDPASYVGHQPGVPLAYSTDEGVTDYHDESFDEVSLRVYPAPSAAEAGTKLKLRVVRLPLCDFRDASRSTKSEIPRMHQIQMLDWAAYLALRIVDDDAGMERRALEFRASFESHVKEARAVVMRKLFAPMGWGFGQGGWSWG